MGYDHGAGSSLKSWQFITWQRNALILWSHVHRSLLLYPMLILCWTSWT